MIVETPTGVVFDTPAKYDGRQLLHDGKVVWLHGKINGKAHTLDIMVNVGADDLPTAERRQVESFASLLCPGYGITIRYTG
ncbi:hypothetical protein CMO83_04215 [Candidatus Woesearchaeota archaeon]|jgi:hypothetical protein|nr:hypothetical protein [Candidatus Woesearchaeota archaeon]MDP6648326.1 hypothetical protein [Candidatus Woesearchaeota archaeon]|tara:strand:- start:7341 stop:7583 length:243 start_codon:yes stop_codon:yes gene_type:complete